MSNAPAKPKAVAPKTPGGDKLTFWLVLGVGAPLVIFISVWVGRGLARLAVKDPAPAHLQTLANPPAEGEEEVSEEGGLTVVETRGGDGESAREAARRAIEEARGNQGSYHQPEAARTREEARPRESADAPGEEIQIEEGATPASDEEAATPPREDFMDIEGDDLTGELGDQPGAGGDYPSSMPMKGRDKLNEGAGLIPPPAKAPSQPQDDEDLFDNDPTNTPSFMGDSPGAAPPKPQGGGKPPAEPGPGQSAAPRPGYSVQVASFGSQQSAEALSKELASRGYRAGVTRQQAGGKELYKVKVGNFPSREQAEAAEKSLHLQNYPGFVQEQ